MAESDRRPRWLPVVAAWLVLTIALLATWHAALRPAAVQEMPRWFLRIARLTGSVVYDDPALALRIQITRLILVATAVTGAWIAILERRRLVRAITTLVNQESDPLNLAIFRIVVFWQIYNVADFDFIARYASLPTALQYPPQTGIPRVGPLAALALWPLHTVPPRVIAFAGAIMKCAAVTAAIGFFSRISAAIVSVLFLLAWGRLQWYGKVDHQHHLFWFAVLLALSPCGDALSLDALVARFRRSHAGNAIPPAPSRRYGMPLNFSMILIGVIYFFPGLWKVCRSGLDWALSDSPKLMMQQVWRMYGGWRPLFRFDEHPLLYHAGALGALLFELSFLFLLLGRRTRVVGAVLGLGFHLATSLTLNIEFATLRNCYVVFVNWRGLLRRIRAAASSVLRKSSPVLDPDAGVIRPDGTNVLPARDRPRETYPVAIAIVGTFMIVGHLWAGAIRAMDGWPFACYPPFDGLSQPSYRTMRIDVTLKDGSTRLIVPDDYRSVFGKPWNMVLQRIIQTGDDNQRRRRLQLVWQVLDRTEPWMADARYLRFYSVRRFVDPTRWNEEPDDARLLYETATAR